MKIIAHFVEVMTSAASNTSSVLELDMLPIMDGKPSNEYLVEIRDSRDSGSGKTIVLSPGEWRFVLRMPQRPVAMGTFSFKEEDVDQNFYFLVDGYELRLTSPAFRTQPSTTYIASSRPLRLTPSSGERAAEIRSQALDSHLPNVSLWTFKRNTSSNIAVDSTLDHWLDYWLREWDAAGAVSKKEDIRIVQLGKKRQSNVDTLSLEFYAPYASLRAQLNSVLTISYKKQNYLLMLPMSSKKNARITVEISYQETDNPHDDFLLGVEVTQPDSIVNAMTNFLAAGDIPSAWSIASNLSNSKTTDAVFITAFALVLINAFSAHLSASDNLDVFAEELTTKFPLMPDAWICRAWLVALGKTSVKDSQEKRRRALMYLRESTRYGIPSYTAAAKLLTQGYETFALGRENDAEDKAILKEVRILSIHTIQNSPLTLLRVDV